MVSKMYFFINKNVCLVINAVPFKVLYRGLDAASSVTMPLIRALYEVPSIKLSKHVL
jgi:hypothetical protein